MCVWCKHIGLLQSACSQTNTQIFSGTLEMWSWLLFSWAQMSQEEHTQQVEALSEIYTTASISRMQVMEVLLCPASKTVFAHSNHTWSSTWSCWAMGQNLHIQIQTHTFALEYKNKMSSITFCTNTRCARTENMHGAGERDVDDYCQ